MAPSGMKEDPKKAKADAAAKAEEDKKKSKAKADAKARKVAEESITKVPAPDRSAHDEKVKKVNDSIERLQKAQAELAKQINSKSTGKEEFFAKKGELRKQLDEVQGRIDAVAGKKDKIYEEIGEKKASDKAAKDNLQNMKKAQGKYQSAAEIDKRIADIEFNMWTSSLSLNEEKKCLVEISDLKRQKPKVAKVADMLAAASGGASSGDTGAMRDQAKLLSGNIKELLEEKRGISGKLKELNEERQAQMGDMPEIFEERQKLSGKIQEKIVERNELRDAFRAGEREYNEYQNELRKVRAEWAVKEREARQKEYEGRKQEKQVEALEETPHLAEMTLIEQTIIWCKTQMPKEKKEVGSAEKKDVDFNNPEGSMVMLKKSDREEEFFFAPTKKKGGKKQKGGKDDAKSGSASIKHNVETFRLFDALKLDAPLNQSEVPDIMAKLEGQMADYVEKVKVWEDTKEERKQKLLEGKKDEEKKEEAATEEKKDEE